MYSSKLNYGHMKADLLCLPSRTLVPCIYCRWKGSDSCSTYSAIVFSRLRDDLEMEQEALYGQFSCEKFTTTAHNSIWRRISQRKPLSVLIAL